jgi:hypothetical protein
MRSIGLCVPAVSVSGLLLMAGCGGTGGGSTAQNPSPGSSNPTPLITSVTPATVLAGAADTTITLSGTGFVTSSSVQWNGQKVATAYESSGGLTAVVPAASLLNGGSAAVTVANPAPGGGTSGAVPVQVNNPLPAIVTITPTSAVAGAGATPLDVKGTGFVPSSRVTWNGVDLSTSFVSTGELTTSLPASSILGSSEDMVTVANPAPGGGTSAAVTYDINSPVPVISTISPRNVPPGAAATITLTGMGFETNSVVLWNGAPRATSFVSGRTLQVQLSAADLQSQGVGSLTVSNPGPQQSTSAPAGLNVTSQPIPTITNVAISPVAAQFPGPPCPRLQVTVTGTNFDSYTTLQANATTLEMPNNTHNTKTVVGLLPQGSVSQSNALNFTVTNPQPGGTSIISDAYEYPAAAGPAIAICANPSPTTVYAGTNFSFTVQPTEVNAAAGTVTLGKLPAGITTGTTTIPLSATGATFHLQAAASAPAGTFDIALTATAGTASASGNFNVTVSTGTPPGFGFLAPSTTEVGVPIGGSGTIQYGTIVSGSNNVDYDITPSVSGLPQGTHASFTPETFVAGQGVTVTLTADRDSPVTQNVTVTLTGTPVAQVSPASANFLIDVTAPPGSLPNSRTDFTLTSGTPYWAVYDTSHDLIFASNPDWNRVDVISNKTHAIVTSIPIRTPRYLDITQDQTQVWVQTETQSIYAIDTTTLKATHYLLPNGVAGTYATPDINSHDKLYALADGTIYLYFTAGISGVNANAVIWNPKTSQLRTLDTNLGYSPFTLSARTGDAAHLFGYGGVTPQIIRYDVVSQTVTQLGTAPGVIAAVNQDGSRLIFTNGSTIGLFDQSLSSLGTVPGVISGFFPALLNGGAEFSPDGSRIYVNGSLNNMEVIATVDAASLQALGTAPSAFVEPVGTSGAFGNSTPFAVDTTGMLLAIQNFGIAFEDATFYQHYSPNQQLKNGIGEYILAPGGPLAGGTSSSLPIYTSLKPDVWFGKTRGTSDVMSTQVQFISPPSDTPGPVNVKLIFPDGVQMFYPQFFTYSTFLQHAVTSGSGPEGGAAATVIGYGLPQTPSGGTVTVGANPATITTNSTQYPAFSGEPYPSTLLNYTLPAGTPGWADLQVETPIGSGTLPKAIFYAKSVTDHGSKDTFRALLLDSKRQQIYAAAGDHIDIFSTASHSFVGQLHPAALGTNKQFTAMSLTPDGSRLLVADLLDGSLAVINPDAPSSTYAISIAAVDTSDPRCSKGPLYVAAASSTKAFVTTGGLPGIGCDSAGITYIADLQARTAARPTGTGQCRIGVLPTNFEDGLSVSAPADGSFVAIGASNYSPACVYSTAANTYTVLPLQYGGYGYGVSVSADGNVIGSNQVLGDAQGNNLGTVSRPIALYGGQNAQPIQPTHRPTMNASGSLFYFAYPSYLEIIDVQHAMLRMRFALTETVQDTPESIAIDSGGRFVYLITDKGLTEVDLGHAPLSIGHLSQTSATAGSMVTIRGSGFDAGTTLTVGGTAAAVMVTDEDTLTFTMPAAASGPEDIVLTRADGESYTLENAIFIP